MVKDETTPEHINRMADDGAGNLRSASAIETAMEAEFAELGNVVTSPAGIPADASIRPAGAFTDAQDALGYLERGGLVTVSDAGDNIPVGFVYFHQVWDEVLYEWVYQIWIDENS